MFETRLAAVRAQEGGRQGSISIIPALLKEPERQVCEAAMCREDRGRC
jgi:hypothetical protein